MRMNEEKEIDNKKRERGIMGNLNRRGREGGVFLTERVRGIEESKEAVKWLINRLTRERNEDLL